MKLLTVIGARPQFIKAAPVCAALAEVGVNERIVHTGQHFDANMSAIFFEEMKIPAPVYELGIHSLSHSAMTGQMMIGLERIILKERPDALMVYGDTNSTLAGALAAKKLMLPVVHVEAGLRSYNDKMPEEINRIITDSISDIMFCPSPLAVANLQAEGLVKLAKVVLSGDVMFDSILSYAQLARPIASQPSGEFVLFTMHRQENTEDRQAFQRIISAVNEIAKDTRVVFPVHPRVKKLLSASSLHKNVYCIDPVGYLEMLWLLQQCTLVLTDSGGLQKEAFFSGKFCLTLREETEWKELVDHGYNHLCGSDPTKIIRAFRSGNHKPIKDPPALYGDGTASKIIARELRNSF